MLLLVVVWEWVSSRNSSFFTRNTTDSPRGGEEDVVLKPPLPRMLGGCCAFPRDVRMRTKLDSL